MYDEHEDRADDSSRGILLSQRDSRSLRIASVARIIITTRCASRIVRDASRCMTKTS
jgi:hypothetical protein